MQPSEAQPYGCEANTAQNGGSKALQQGAPTHHLIYVDAAQCLAHSKIKFLFGELSGKNIFQIFCRHSGLKVQNSPLQIQGATCTVSSTVGRSSDGFPFSWLCHELQVLWPALLHL